LFRPFGSYTGSQIKVKERSLAGIALNFILSAGFVEQLHTYSPLRHPSFGKGKGYEVFLHTLEFLS